MMLCPESLDTSEGNGQLKIFLKDIIPKYFEY